MVFCLSKYYVEETVTSSLRRRFPAHRVWYHSLQGLAYIYNTKKWEDNRGVLHQFMGHELEMPACCSLNHTYAACEAPQSC